LPFDGEPLLLSNLGFTRTQAKIYLTLLRLQESDAKNISKTSNVPKPEVYRTLKELQKMGIAEKQITKPIKYTATPLHFALQILMTQKVQQYKKMESEMKRYLRNHQSCPLEIPQEKEYKLSMIEGKQRLTQVIRHQHDKVLRRVDILSNVQRWMQILDTCLTNYEKALDRGVKYRLVVEKHMENNEFPEELRGLLARPNFDLRLSCDYLAANATIFDNKEATISFLQGKPIGESPLIWTNHPSLIQMCQDHFDKVWKSSREYKIQKASS
jgi:sugar-specific transcriptional regulator TrmB